MFKFRRVDFLGATYIHKYLLVEVFRALARHYFLRIRLETEASTRTDKTSAGWEIFALFLLFQICFVFFSAFRVADLVHVLAEHVSELGLVHRGDDVSHLLGCDIAFAWFREHSRI